ncbi:MAG: exosortase/archaeosortase family protein [Candidatus Aenigmarchaeota archaeon]|nr:exosortase/archaeosortase family protein [Candidatus Aenigmarchaeota archaeon]
MKLTKKQKEMLSVLIFLIKMIILVFPIYMVLHFGISLYPLQEAVTGQSFLIFNIAGFSPAREGFFITISKTHEFTFAISEDCTPWKSIWLLIALMIAVPAISVKRRFLGMFAGSIVLWIGNLARIFYIVWTEQFISYDFAMALHDYFWKAFLVVLVILIWIVWLQWNDKLKRR